MRASYATRRVLSSPGVGFSYVFSGERKKWVYLSMPLEPIIGASTLHVALGKRLPGPPSDWSAPDHTSCDWSAPDHTYCWLKGSRYTFLCLLKRGFTYVWLQLYLSPRNSLVEVFSGENEILPQVYRGRVTGCYGVSFV